MGLCRLITGKNAKIGIGGNAGKYSRETCVNPEVHQPDTIMVEMRPDMHLVADGDEARDNADCNDPRTPRKQPLR